MRKTGKCTGFMVAQGPVRILPVSLFNLSDKGPPLDQVVLAVNQ